MRRPRLHRAVAVSAILALGLALTACTTAPPAPDHSASSTPNAGTEPQRPAFEPLTVDDFAVRISTAMQKAGVAHISQVMDLAGAQVTAEGEMTFTADYAAVKAHIIQNGPTGRSETIIVDGQMYMNLGELTQDKFMLFAEGNGMFEPRDVIGAFTPATQMETFGQSIREFTVGGSETIDGVETTQYTLVLDTATLLSGSLTAGIDPATVGETVTYVVWVGNEDDLQRRTQMTFGGTTTTVDFTRWGEPVDIQAPAPDQIVS